MRYFMCIVPRTQLATFCFGLALAVGAFSAPLSAQSKAQHQIKREMDARFLEIMEEKAGPFLDYILTQENYLRINQETLAREMLRRKKDGSGLIVWEDEDQGRSLELISQYKEELTKIVEIHQQISEIQRGDLASNQTARSQIDALKRRLDQLVGGSPAFNRRLSKHVADVLAKDFSFEIGRLSSVLSELDDIQSSSTGQRALLDQVAELNASIVASLGGASVAHVSDEQVEQYIQEVTRLVAVLEQLDELDTRLPFEQTAAHQRIRGIKDKVYQLIPRDALLAAGYFDTEIREQSSRMLSHLDLWISSRSLWILAHKNKAQVRKQRLIEAGSAAQVKRMFQADLTHAIDEFNQQRFKTAELLFQDLIRQYPYNQKDDLRYYYGESLWHQQQFQKARSAYTTLTKTSPRSPYTQRAYYRLMLIADTFNRDQEVFAYADKVKALRASGPASSVVDRALLFASTVAYNRGDFARAQRWISSVDGASPSALPGQYLNALIGLHQDPQDEAALSSLSQLVQNAADSQDPVLRRIASHARLKVGLIHYLNDDPQMALSFLQDVAEGSPNYDVVLLAMAWSSYRLDDLSSAARYLNRLFWKHSDSDYLYEATMLSAHCDRVLGRIGSSTRKVRYVEQAGASLDLSNAYNTERAKINQVLVDLRRLEESAIRQSDLFAFQRVQSLARHLEPISESLDYQPGHGVQYLHEIAEEEQALAQLVEEIADDQAAAEAMGRRSTSETLAGLEEKLRRETAQLQFLSRPEEASKLADYPLARRESERLFRTAATRNMLNQIALEKRRIEQAQKQLRADVVVAKNVSNHGAARRLEYERVNLDKLGRALEAMHVALAKNELEAINSDYTQWSDFSGFGMSDEGFDRLREVNDQVEQYGADIGLINSVMRQRETKLVQQIAILDDQIEQLEEEELRKQIEALQAERKRFFEEEYFIANSVATEQQAEMELQKMIEGEVVPAKQENNASKQEN